MQSRTYLSTVLFLLLSMGLGAAPAQAQTRAYVANFGSTVSVIDTATNTVVATIPVGLFPEGVAITPDGTRAYVAGLQSRAPYSDRGHAPPRQTVAPKEENVKSRILARITAMNIKYGKIEDAGNSKL